MLEIGNKCGRSVARRQNQPTTKKGDDDDVGGGGGRGVRHLCLDILRNFETREAVKLRDRGMPFRQVHVFDGNQTRLALGIMDKIEKGRDTPEKNENWCLFHLYFEHCYTINVVLPNLLGFSAAYDAHAVFI